MYFGFHPDYIAKWLLDCQVPHLTSLLNGFSFLVIFYFFFILGRAVD